MIENQGWVKLHRSILEWEWYKDANTKSLFFHLIIKANRIDKKYQGIQLKRGELIVGRKSLSVDLGLSEQQVRTSLNKLKSTNEITIKTTNKFSVVGVVNYDFYQVSEMNQPATQPTDNQQTTNKQPTSNQQITTNKNIENNKNERIEEYSVCDIVEKNSTSPTQKFSFPSKQPIETLKKNCAGYSEWLTVIAKKNSLNMLQVLEWLDAFEIHLLGMGKTEETESEFKKFFNAWITSEIRLGRKPKVENQSKDAPKKTVEQIAQEVIIKKYGNRAYES